MASISVSGAVTREAHVILDEAKLDALSEKLADAVRTELNKTKLDLQKAKDQVEKGQAQLDEAKEAIAAGAAAKAGAAVDKLYEYLKEARGQIPEPDPDPDPGEPPITVPGLEQLQKTLERLNATLDKLMKDLESGELKREVTSEVYNMTLSLIDGITQLTEAQIQLDEAMTQIEAGMDQINEAYKSIADQTDVGGMLSISAVSQLLTAQNFAMPAGYIEDNDGVRYMVSVGENVSPRQELEDMVLLDLGIEGIEPVTLALVRSPEGVLLQQRPEKGLLAGLWQPVLWEDESLSADEARARLAALGVVCTPDAAKALRPARHIFSHIEWHMGGYLFMAERQPAPVGCVWASPEQLEAAYTLPGAFKAYRKLLAAAF